MVGTVRDVYDSSVNKMDKDPLLGGRAMPHPCSAGPHDHVRHLQGSWSLPFYLLSFLARSPSCIPSAYKHVQILSFKKCSLHTGLYITLPSPLELLEQLGSTSSHHFFISLSTWCTVASASAIHMNLFSSRLIEISPYSGWIGVLFSLLLLGLFKSLHSRILPHHSSP